MFYSVLCMLGHLGSLATFLVGISRPVVYRDAWVAGLVSFFCLPVALEFLINVKGILFRGRLRRQLFVPEPDCLPIVYSKKYNITAFGLEKCHPFDSCKYGRIFNHLIKKKVISPDSKIHCP